jgi:methionyl-tRNA synthetase
VREYEFKGAIDAIMALAAYGNSYIQNAAPWKLLKEDKAAAEQVIRDCLQIAKALVLLFDAVIPESAAEAWHLLGYDDTIQDHTFADAVTGFDHTALPKPKILFEKIEDDRLADLEAVLNELVAVADGKATLPASETDKTTTPEESTEEDTMITIDEFANVEMTVGKVLEAEQIEGSKKLLRIQVDIGTETRQVVSGIAPFYGCEELVGQTVIVVTNLKPAKLFGVESNGMILAAGDDAALLTTVKDTAPGTKVL